MNTLQRTALNDPTNREEPRTEQDIVNEAAMYAKKLLETQAKLTELKQKVAVLKEEIDRLYTEENTLLMQSNQWKKDIQDKINKACYGNDNT